MDRVTKQFQRDFFLSGIVLYNSKDIILDNRLDFIKFLVLAYKKAIFQNIIHHLYSQGCSIFLPFSHTLVWNRIISDSSSASWIPFLASSVLTRPINAWITFMSIGFYFLFSVQPECCSQLSYLHPAYNRLLSWYLHYTLTSQKHQ